MRLKKDMMIGADLSAFLAGVMLQRLWFLIDGIYTVLREEVVD